MPASKNFPLGTAVLGLAFLLVMLLTYLLIKPPAPPAELLGVINRDYRQLGEFSLDSAKGDGLSRDDFEGKWSFVFFGYTYCPDICPATLHELGQVFKLLKDDQNQGTNDVQVIFVSVDPKRDTPEKLREYLSYFNTDFIGATGDSRQIEQFSRQFGAGSIIEPETSAGQYIVIHTSAIFLVDPLARTVASFSQPHYAQTIHSQFVKIRDYFTGNQILKP